MSDINNTNGNTDLNSWNEVIEGIKNRDNMYQRNLTHEIAIYSFFKNGLISKIEDEDWRVQLDDEEKLFLSSTNTSTDLSRSPIMEDTKLNNKTIVFDDQTGLDDFTIKNAVIIRQDTVFESICRRTTIARATEIINRNYDDNSPKKFRTIILYNDKIQNIIFHYFFAHFIADKSQRMCIGIITDKYLSILSGISFSYKNTKYLVYIYSTSINSPTKYLVIEALDPTIYKEHIDASNKILSAVGFFTTIYPFGPYMIFDASSEQSVFVAYKNCYDKPRIAKYTMLTLNPYAYYTDSDIQENVFRKVNNVEGKHSSVLSVEAELKPIEKRHFEQLLALLDDKKFFDMFYILQKVSSTVVGGQYSSYTDSLILYAACLETSVKWFHSSYDQSAATNRSLLSDKARKEIIDKFFEILEAYKNEDQDDVNKLKNKITGYLFNRPNADNLSVPFKHFGIELSKEDCFLLDLRNKILHGSDVLEPKFNLDNIIPYFLKAEQYCFGFYSLIWRLIMKAIGYEGVYRDEAKMLEKQTGDQSNGGEPFVKKI